MDMPPWMLLVGVIVLLLLAVGIFAAVILYLGKGQSNKRPEPAAAAPPAQQRPVQVAVPLPAAAPAETPAHPGEVMRVIRDEETGRLLVEVEGRRYAHIREIGDARVGRRVLWAIADLVRFTGGMATNPQAMRSIGEPPPAAAAAAPTTGPVAPPPVSATPPPVSVTSSPPPISTRSTVSSLAEPERPRYSMTEFFRRGLQPNEPAVAGPTSFIEEIDEILQGYLERLPQRPVESVHVLSAKDGTLCIEVGDTRYDSVEQVPLPEIQQLIRAAVAEWEQR